MSDKKEEKPNFFPKNKFNSFDLFSVKSLSHIFIGIIVKVCADYAIQRKFVWGFVWCLSSFQSRNF